MDVRGYENSISAADYLQGISCTAADIEFSYTLTSLTSMRPCVISRICRDIIPLSVDRVQGVRSRRDQRLEGATHTPAQLLRGREAFGKR